MRLFRCTVCDKPFEPARSDAIYCGAACKQRALRRRRKDELTRLRAFVREAARLA